MALPEHDRRCSTLTPEVLEPIRRHGRVDGGVADVLVAKPMLQGSGVVTVIGELESAGMAQHVGDELGITLRLQHQAAE